MISRRRAAVALAAAALFGAGLLLASCGRDDGGEVAMTTEATTEPATDTTTVDEVVKLMRVEVENGLPKGGIVRDAVFVGDRVAITVRSDVADEVHLHGYDISRSVEAGGSVRLEFTANLPGRFEVELEDRGVQIAEITVEP